jgi:hypothetical protein
MNAKFIKDWHSMRFVRLALEDYIGIQAFKLKVFFQGFSRFLLLYLSQNKFWLVEL